MRIGVQYSLPDVYLYIEYIFIIRITTRNTFAVTIAKCRQ